MSVIEKENCFLILTDLETDDLAAICLLSEFKRNSKIMFVVGEGSSSIKVHRMEFYIEKLGFSKAKVIQGYSSKKKFPYDGLDVMTEDERNDIMDIDKDKKEIKEEIAEFIKKEEPFIISLKPPRELIELWDEGFDMSKYILAGYMSFNLRCLMREWKPNLVNFLTSFRTCYFFETKYSVGGSTYSAITEKDFDFAILPRIVINLMYHWNKHQDELCDENIKKLSEKSDEGSNQRLHRNKATKKQVVDNNYKQFVNADTGLILSLLEKGASYKYRKINYDLKSRNAYPILGKGTDVKVIMPDDVLKYREIQINMMKEIFKRMK